MKLSATEQESLTKLLTRIYTDIAEIEQEFQLLVGDHDFRPRIDYFHDAIRAFTAQNPKDREPGGRLCIELLAYDVSCLRYIQSMPLAPFKPHGGILSPQTEMVEVKPGLMVKTNRPDRAVRERIVELYQHYAVLFAALLKPFADADYHDRVDDLNEEVGQLHDLIHQFEMMVEGKANTNAINAAVQHLEEDNLRHELMQFMQQQKFKKKENLKKLAQFLKELAGRKDKEIKDIEAAHMEYALAQLAIFEDAKDMLKKMASQGMNIVGSFVQNAIAQAQREMGR